MSSFKVHFRALNFKLNPIWKFKHIMVTTHTTFFENFLETSKMQAFADWNNGIKRVECFHLKTIESLKKKMSLFRIYLFIESNFQFEGSWIDLDLILCHQLSCQVKLSSLIVMQVHCQIYAECSLMYAASTLHASQDNFSRI